MPTAVAAVQKRQVEEQIKTERSIRPRENSPRFESLSATLVELETIVTDGGKSPATRFRFQENVSKRDQTRSRTIAVRVLHGQHQGRVAISETNGLGTQAATAGNSSSPVRACKSRAKRPHAPSEERDD